MSSFLYFVENRQQPIASRQQLEEIGLGHIQTPTFSGEIPTGPSKGRGYLLAQQQATGAAYQPDKQRWKRRPDGVWVGVQKDAPPTPQTLQRPTMLSGLPVELNGKAWQVPVILAYDTDAQKVPMLPRVLDTDETGRVVPGDVCEQHRWLIETVDPFLQSWTQQRDAAIAAEEETWTFNFDRDAYTRMAVRVLSANYRLACVEEAVLLQLFTTERGAFEVLYAACDCDFYDYMSRKKKEADAATESLPTTAG